MIIDFFWFEKFSAPLAFDQPERTHSFVRDFVLQKQSFFAPRAAIGFKQATYLMLTCLFNVYECSTLLVHADHLSFLALGDLMSINILFKE